MFVKREHVNSVMVLAICFIVASLSFCEAAAQDQTPSPWKGRDLFQSKGCIRCHSVYGEGGRGGPDLGIRKFYGTYLELAALMWDHFPGMAKKMRKISLDLPEFTEQEMAAIINYLSYIRYLGEPGNEAKGRRLLITKGCVKCHKFGGRGGDIGPNISAIKEYLSPLRLVESMWNHGPQLMDKFEQYNIKRPEFVGKEMIDLAVGLRSYMSPTKVPVSAFALGDPARGKQIAEKKGCLRCHAAKGEGADVGPDFREIDLSYSITQIAGKMWNHTPRMLEKMKQEGIAFPVFERGEMTDVISFIYSLQLQDDPGSPVAGEKLVKTHGCLKCHSLRSEGGEEAIDLAEVQGLRRPLSMITAMWNHAPSMEEKAREKKIDWPELTGKNMADLYAFLQSLAAENAKRK